MTAPTITPTQLEGVLEPGVSHAHIENPERIGYALCLIPLTGTRTTGGDCPICVDLAFENRAWISR